MTLTEASTKIGRSKAYLHATRKTAPEKFAFLLSFHTNPYQSYRLAYDYTLDLITRTADLFSELTVTQKKKLLSPFHTTVNDSQILARFEGQIYKVLDEHNFSNFAFNTIITINKILDLAYIWELTTVPNIKPDIIANNYNNFKGYHKRCKLI